MNNLDYETKLWLQGYNFVAGVDEVGRGPLAGPVVAAAVIFVKEFYCEDVNDSKKLSPQKREELFSIIKENAISVGVGFVREKVIDEINIRQASFLAMQRALMCLKIKPDYILVDGRDKIPQIFFPQLPIINGDSLSFTISAASIIAKVTRDKLMDRYHNLWPEYNFSSHKGYGTEEHIECLKKYGPCRIHRMSYKPVSQLTGKPVNLTG